MRVLIWLGYFCLGLCINANARVSITGKIVDGESGQPLPTANIRVENTFLATIANEDGALRPF